MGKLDEQCNRPRANPTGNAQSIQDTASPAVRRSRTNHAVTQPMTTNHAVTQDGTESDTTTTTTSDYLGGVLERAELRTGVVFHGGAA
ncbi:hypothetical protein HALLA_12230 [Halostagnicola larsenii XH-48]|uniref:Uncharacterized protein n=1 Tax=Halostagnicola larsenii XH-48 TaxID=797299 RepID=W0JQV9_9EURY|nr:hypothetical protein HALLA_12230 [Halostagnicola larsenii XH-48]